MALDAGIYSQIQPSQPANPLNALAQAYQVAGLRDQSEQRRSAAEQQNKLMALVGGPDFQKMDTTGKASALQGVGAFEQAGNLVRTDAAANKDKREAEKFQLEGQLKKFEVAGQIMNGVSDQATWERAIQQTAQIFGPEAAAQMPPQWDPKLVEQKRMQAMTVKDQVEQRYKMLTLGETQRHHQATEGLQANGQAITMRGQDMTQGTAMRGQDMADTRARETNANGRIPSGYRQSADGGLEFIPGGPADPSAAKRAAPTEFQGKSAIFGARAQEADRLLSELGTDFSPMAINAKNAVGNTPLVGGALEAGANVMLSGNSQKAEQAQRDYINAILRLESGAAIGKEEFANAKRQYFPQPGDSKEVIAQKAANRKLQIQGLLGNAGNAPIPKAPGAVITIKTAADYQNVPSGAEYIAPDGKKRRKP